MAIVRAWQLLWLEVYADLDAVYRRLLQLRYRTVCTFIVDSQLRSRTCKRSYRVQSLGIRDTWSDPQLATGNFRLFSTAEHKLQTRSLKLGTVYLGISLPSLFSNAVHSPDTLHSQPTPPHLCQQGTCEADGTHAVTILRCLQGFNPERTMRSEHRYLTQT